MITISLQCLVSNLLFLSHALAHTHSPTHTWKHTHARAFEDFYLIHFEYTQTHIHTIQYFVSLTYFEWQTKVAIKTEQIKTVVHMIAWHSPIQGSKCLNFVLAQWTVILPSWYHPYCFLSNLCSSVTSVVSMYWEQGHRCSPSFYWHRQTSAMRPLKLSAVKRIIFQCLVAKEKLDHMTRDFSRRLVMFTKEFYLDYLFEISPVQLGHEASKI